MDASDVPVVGRETPTENEQRALGGFFAETEYQSDDFELIQVEVPIGCQRVASAFDKDTTTDISLSDVLASRSYSGVPRGFPDEKELSNRYGFSMTSYTAKADAVIITQNRTFVIEVKTRNQRIEGLHDVNEGFGQVLMNRDRFQEDYPSVANAQPLTALLLAEGSDVEVELVRDSFTARDVALFDPCRDGFLIEP